MGFSILRHSFCGFPATKIDLFGAGKNRCRRPQVQRVFMSVSGLSRLSSNVILAINTEA
jgi:hypothetical protein